MMSEANAERIDRILDAHTYARMVRMANPPRRPRPSSARIERSRRIYDARNVTPDDMEYLATGRDKLPCAESWRDEVSSYEAMVAQHRMDTNLDDRPDCCFADAINSVAVAINADGER